MLTAAEIESMRATVDGTLVDTCTISRATVVSDGAGGQTSTWAAVAENVPCHVAPRDVQGQEDEVADRVGGRARWTVRLADGTDIRLADRILTGGRILEVVSLGAPRTWELVRIVESLEVT